MKDTPGAVAWGPGRPQDSRPGTAGAVVSEELGTVWEVGRARVLSHHKTNKRTNNTYTQKNLVYNPGFHESAPILHLLMI